MCVTLYSKFVHGKIVCVKETGLELRRSKIIPNNVCKSVSLKDTPSQQRTLPVHQNWSVLRLLSSAIVTINLVYIRNNFVLAVK